MVEFRTDDGRAIPSKKEAGVLSSGFDEGSIKVVAKAREDTKWAPPENSITMPDYSKVEHLKKYFGKRDYEAYPAVIYNKDGTSKTVKDHEEAKENGVFYREATVEERGRYGRDAVWDWRDDSPWRPHPWGEHLDKFGKLKVDLERAGDTKNVIVGRIDPVQQNHSLIKELLPQLAALLGGQLNKAPSDFTEEELREFRRFQAIKKAAEPQEVKEAAPAWNALAAAPEPVDEREMWIAEATRLGVEVDRRWSLETLKRKIEESQ